MKRHIKFLSSSVQCTLADSYNYKIKREYQKRCSLVKLSDA